MRKVHWLRWHRFPDSRNEGYLNARIRPEYFELGRLSDQTLSRMVIGKSPGGERTPEKHHFDVGPLACWLAMACFIWTFFRDFLWISLIPVDGGKPQQFTGL
jgi:hypothetical protein